MLTVGAAAAALVLLVGCGSDSSSSGTTTSAAMSATSSAATSSASSAKPSTTKSSSAAAESSDELETSFSAPSPTTTVGGDTTSLDAQSTTWFDTMCTGMAPLTSLQNVTSQQELSDAMTQAGQAFQATGSQLATLPPPTFDGGTELAQSATSGFQSFGQTFIDFGQKVLDIDDNDTAAQQQFTSDLAAAAATSPVAQIRLTPALTQAVQAIPSCQSLFSSGS